MKVDVRCRARVRVNISLTIRFCEGTQVFGTSDKANPVQRGAVAAWSPISLGTNTTTLAIDTEGLEGGTDGSPAEGAPRDYEDYSLRRDQLLLKVFAISDVVIYVSVYTHIHALSVEGVQGDHGESGPRQSSRVSEARI